MSRPEYNVLLPLWKGPETQSHPHHHWHRRVAVPASPGPGPGAGRRHQRRLCGGPDDDWL